MTKITIANSQSFQAIYIDTDAKKDADKIVLIEELVDSEPEAVGILNTMMKEPYFGMVIGGSSINLAKFRSKVYDEDKQESLGGKDIKVIIPRLAKLSIECKCEVIYFKGPIQYKELPNVSVAFDFKKLFDMSKIKEGGAEFWNNLLGVNKQLEKSYQELDIKKHAELMDYLNKNERVIDELRKDLKKKGETNFLDEILEDMDSFSGLEQYLGKDYEDKVFYKIPANQLSKLGDTPQGIAKTMWSFLGKVYLDRYKRDIPADLISGIAYNEKDKFVLVVTEDPLKFDLKWWPPRPSRVTPADLNTKTLKFVPAPNTETKDDKTDEILKEMGDKAKKEESKQKRADEDTKFWSDPAGFED